MIILYKKLRIFFHKGWISFHRIFSWKKSELLTYFLVFGGVLICKLAKHHEGGTGWGMGVRGWNAQGDGGLGTLGGWEGDNEFRSYLCYIFSLLPLGKSFFPIFKRLIFLEKIFSKIFRPSNIRNRKHFPPYQTYL